MDFAASTKQQYDGESGKGIGAAPDQKGTRCLSDEDKDLHRKTGEALFTARQLVAGERENTDIPACGNPT